MAAIHFSEAALEDIKGIDDYTFREWGEEQAIRYADQLAVCCNRIGSMPLSGRQCNEIFPGLRRVEQGRHVIFYQPLDSGIYIWRILHDSMLPTMNRIIE